jgi:hypothetical protein
MLLIMTFAFLYLPTNAVLDRAIASLLPTFLGFLTIGEGFEFTATCKAWLQGFSLGQVE